MFVSPPAQIQASSLLYWYVHSHSISLLNLQRLIVLIYSYSVFLLCPEGLIIDFFRLTFLVDHITSEHLTSYLRALWFRLRAHFAIFTLKRYLLHLYAVITSDSSSQLVRINPAVSSFASWTSFPLLVAVICLVHWLSKLWSLWRFPWCGPCRTAELPEANSKQPKVTIVIL